MANRVVHFEVEAQDLSRAQKFYATAFGWKMQNMGSDMGSYVVATSGDVKELGINGGLFPADGNKQLNAFRCVIGVDDIAKAMTDVVMAGGKLLAEKPDDIPGIGPYIKCQDSEGNIFALLQPLPQSMPEV